jgi:hypothetical protein
MEMREANGQVSYPLGPDAVGNLVYTADGYMCGAIMSTNRPLFAAPDLLGESAEEQAVAATTYISYAGPYEVQEGKIVHHVGVSLFPNWVGSTQERFYEFSGDRLSLSTPSLLMRGSEGCALLVWERAGER